MSSGETDSEGGNGHTHESACLNCGAVLIGPHCHECGQAAHVHRTLAAFFHDLLHGAFHFEGRIWRTLPMLAIQPGRLTREYVDGRRASYISPIALFLFAAFLLYFTMHALGPHGEQSSTGGTNQQAIAVQRAALVEAQEQLAKATDPAGREAAQAKIDRLRESVAALDKLHPEGGAQIEIGQVEIGKGSDVSSDIPWLDAVLKQFRANPDLAVYKLQMSAYKYSWLLIPISAPFLWLLFPFSRRFRLYDHTVFVTYSLAFMTLFGVVLTLAGAIHAPYLAVVAALVPPLHMYRQLKGAYGLSRGAALWRTALLLSFAFTALLLFAALLVSGLG